MNFADFWDVIVRFGPNGRRIPGPQSYCYKVVTEGGKEKLCFRSPNARKPYTILKPKAEEYFRMLHERQVDACWFRRNRSAWFYALYEDVLSLD